MKYGPLLEVPAADVFRIWHGRGLRTPGLQFVAEVVFHVLTYLPPACGHVVGVLVCCVARGAVALHAAEVAEIPEDCRVALLIPLL